MKQKKILNRMLALLLTASMVFGNSSSLMLASTNATGMDYATNEEYTDSSDVRVETDSELENSQEAIAEETSSSSSDEYAGSGDLYAEEAYPTETPSPDEMSSDVIGSEDIQQHEEEYHEEAISEESGSEELYAEEDAQTLQDIRESYFMDITEIPEDVAKLDFSNMRLIVAVEDEKDIIDPENELSGYNNIFLMQYLSKEQAMQAYVYYSKVAALVSVDTEVKAAELDVTGDRTNYAETLDENDQPAVMDLEPNTEEIVSEQNSSDSHEEVIEANSDTVQPESGEAEIVANEKQDGTSTDENVQDHNDEIQSDDGMSESQNPVSELIKQVSDDTENQVSYTEEDTQKEEKEHPLIALIDTGASESEHIVGRVSMLGEEVDDDNGHGDAMVGYILEEDPSARILSIKALDKDGRGTISSVYTAIEYAMLQNVQIINLSLSAYNTEENSALAEIVDRATAQGITVVGAAGNNGKNVKFFVPGNIENAMVIAACDQDGKVISASNDGDTVDYYVTAGSTSEAAARYSGILSDVNDETQTETKVFDRKGQSENEGNTDNVDPEDSDFHAAQYYLAITYNANGGTGTVATQTKTGIFNTDTITLRNNAYTRTGYNFVQWNTKANASGNGYHAGQEVPVEYFGVQTSVSPQTTSNYAALLYAIWDPNTASVIYNANGGTGTGTTTGDGSQYRSTNGGVVQRKPSGGSWANFTHVINYNNNINLLNVATAGLTKTGYHVDGATAWNTDKNGTGTSYNQDNNYTWNTFGNTGAANKTTTVYANWKPNVLTVYYNANGGVAGTMTNGYKVASDGFLVTSDGTTKVGNRCNYGATFNLINYNNPGSININRPGYYIVSGKEWKFADGSKVFGQDTTYGPGDLASNITTGNRTVNVYANWQPITYNIAYELNGGSFNHAYNSNVDESTTSFTRFVNPTSVNYDNSQTAYVVSSGKTRHDGFFIEHPHKTGYRFKGWTITGMDASEHMIWNSGAGHFDRFNSTTLDTSTVNVGLWTAMLRLTTVNNATVTFTAQWEPLEYNIKGRHVIEAKNGISFAGQTPYTITGAVNKPSASSVSVLHLDDGSHDGVTEGDRGTVHVVSGETYNIANTGETVIMEIPNGYKLTQKFENVKFNGTNAYTPLTTDTNYNTDYEWDGSWLGSEATDDNSGRILYYYEPETYNITYNTRGIGTLPSGAPTSYTVLTGYDTLPTLADTEQYRFRGWRDQNGIAVTSINPGVNNSFDDAEDFYNTLKYNRRTGNLTLNAVWIPKNMGDFNSTKDGELPKLIETENNKGKFLIKETKATGGYILDETPQIIDLNGTVSLDAQGNVVAEFLNQPNRIKIYKTDDSATPVPLPNAKIHLWHDEDGGRNKVHSAGDGCRECVSNNNGEIVSSRLKGGTWHYKEVEAPYGYALDSSVYDINVDVNTGNIAGITLDGFGDVASTSLATIIDPPKDNFYIKKIDGDGAPISGVTFTLSGFGSTITKTTGADGTIKLNLDDTGVNCNVTITEVSLPASYNYLIKADPITIHIDAEGKITLPNGEESNIITFVNRENQLKIRKKDTSNNPITGAVIEIYRNGSLYGSPISLSTEEITLKRLPQGTYTYKETIAPPGYFTDGTTKSLCTVDANNKINGASEAIVNIINPVNEVVFEKRNQDGTVKIQNATFRITRTDGQKIDGTNAYLDKDTDGNGQVKLNKLNPGEYKFVEIKPADGYYLENNVGGTFTISNTGLATISYNQGGTYAKNKNNSITIKKVDTNGTPISNVSFELTKPGGQKVTITTTASGEVTQTGCAPGTYTFVEKSVPNDYVLDTTEHSFVVDVNGYISTEDDGVEITGSGTGTATLKVVNHKKAHVNIVVTKKSAPDDNGATRTLDGAQFKLYSTTNAELATATAMGNGVYRFNNIEVDPVNPKQVIVKETIAPQGFIRNFEKTITIAPAIDTTYDIPVEVTNERNKVKLIKQNGVTGERLYGIKFEMKRSGTSAVSRYTTDQNGTFSVSELVPGSYTIVETETLEGYILDTDPYTFTVNSDGTLTRGSDTNVRELTIVAKNYPEVIEPHDVIVKKKNSSNADLTGAEFRLLEWDKDASGGKYVDNGVTFIYDEVNKQYKASTPALWSKKNLGKFKIEETKAPDGYFKDFVQEFVVNKDDPSSVTYTYTAVNKDVSLKVIKVDADTSAKLKDAVFELSDQNDVTVQKTTNTNGEAVFGPLVDGEYSLTEITPPKGYAAVKSTNSIENVSFAVRDGVISILQSPQGVGSFTVEGNVLTCQMKNKKNSLKVIKTNTKDGSRLPNAEYKLTNGTTTLTKTTNANGEILFEGLEAGSWTLQETRSPDPARFYLSQEKFTIMVEESGLISVDGAEAVVAAVKEVGDPEISNEPGYVEVIKKASDTNATLSGAVFGIYEYNAQTGVYEGNKTLIGYHDYEEEVTDDDGNVTGTESFHEPIYEETPKQLLTYSGGKYRNATGLRATEENLGKFLVVEVEAPDGYAGEWEQEFDISQESLFTFTVPNDPAKFRIHKVNTDGEDVEGAEFDIWNDVDGVSHKVHGVTNASGLLVVGGRTEITGVHKNTTYHILETKAPKGYKRSSEELLIQTDESGFVYGGNNQEIFITNEESSSATLIINVGVDEKPEYYEDISFIYDIVGTDSDGGTVNYSVVLTPDNVTLKDRTVMLNIPRGEYRITQRKPIRYKLQSITGNTPNARQESATTAYCDLTEDDLGEVTFYNVLNQWNMWNGADVKTNHVGPAVEIPPELQGT